MGFIVLEGETLEDLQLNNLYIIQKRDAFRFGMDAVLLANSVRARLGDRVVDLGTGTGIIPMLLTARTQAAKITGIEIQPDIADMAVRSVEGNGLGERIEIRVMDIKNCKEKLGNDYEIVVTNPPYTRYGSGLVNPDEAKAIARHEIMCTLSDVIEASASLLKYHGEFYMVHRPDRLCDIMTEMRRFGLEPKELRLVCPRIGDPASLILIKGINKGNPGMRQLSTLYIYDASGNYSKEARICYGMPET